jgi:anoctamin-4
VFSNSVRIRVIQYILKHTAYGKNAEVGIDRLLAEEVYEDAFPLHEADEEVKSKTDEIKESNLRTILRETWACWAKSLYFQPLCLIKRYFGPQIGIYFTWLGWYTQMLILPSALGTELQICGAEQQLSFFERSLSSAQLF